MITETLCWPDCSGRISDSTLKVVFTYLYVDVKEPAKPQGLRVVWTLEFLLLSKLKTVVVCFVAILGLFGRLFPFPPMVGVAGFEPATLRLSSACSNQLSYTPNGKKWWRHGDSNPRPIACKATALPTELCPQGMGSGGFDLFGSAAGRIGNRSKN